MFNMSESDFVNILESFYDSKKSNESVVKLGTVSSNSTVGSLKIILDGDDEDGDVSYTRLSSYTPVSGDRVLLMRFGTSYIVLGKTTN